MTDLSIVRKQSQNYLLQINDENGAAIDLTDAVVKFAVKRTFSDLNADAIIFKSTYDDTEIVPTDLPNGQVTVRILVSDTDGVNPGNYCWDVVVNRRGTAKSAAGSLGLQAGQYVVLGTGLDFDEMAVGDIVVPAGSTAANQRQFEVEELGGSGGDNDPGAGNIRTDYNGFDTTESGIVFTLFEGNRKYPAGLAGTFTITKEISN